MPIARPMYNKSIPYNQGKRIGGRPWKRIGSPAENQRKGAESVALVVLLDKRKIKAHTIREQGERIAEKHKRSTTMTNLIETIKTVDLKAAVKEHIANQDAQVITCDDLDLAYDCSGNTYNINAPVIIETKTLFASDETKTLVFLTFHNGGDPRGNYEKETYDCFNVRF